MANEKRLIDADALKKCTCEWCNTHYSDEPCEPSECIEILRIDSQPTVDARPVVHGRWENIRFITTGDGRAKVGDCSSCKSIERVRNYCPNCGSQMDGGNEDG